MNNPAVNVKNLLLDADLLTTITAANDAYRNTDKPLLSDHEYDALIAELARRSPGHPFLSKVEPEADFGTSKVRHRRPMLSTLKCYAESNWSNGFAASKKPHLILVCALLFLCL